ncbi:MAG: hypothetical protein RBS19_10760 [Bacteroidales bacterium]|nr:hypothetical protein [Bacteroidales bacterium]
MFVEKLNATFELNLKLGKQIDCVFDSRNPNFFFFNEGNRLARMKILDNSGKITGFCLDDYNYFFNAIFVNYVDEKLGFVMPMSFVKLQIECEHACIEFEEQKHITKLFLFSWLYEYQRNYRECCELSKVNQGLLYKHLSDFLIRYYEMKNLSHFISLYKEVKEALIDFENRSSDRIWLEENYRFRIRISSCINYCSGYIKENSVIKYLDFSIKIKEIDLIYDFLEKFDGLNKYEKIDDIF